MPWLVPSDEPAVSAWCEVEILAAGAFALLTTDGFTTEAGDPRRLLTEYRQLRQVSLAYMKELGITPASRAELGRDIAATERDLDALRAEGRRIRQARDLREGA